MTTMVYKVLPAALWRSARAAGRFAGSSDDMRDGFIHFSTAAQLPGTLAKFFDGQSDLMLLAIRTADLGDQLRWEASTGGTLYPHLYADLAVAAVDREWPLALDADRYHRLPTDLT